MTDGVLTENQQHENATGFTLLELLVALALISLTAALLVGALRSGRQALEIAERNTAEASVGSVQSFVGKLLREARPVRLAGARGNDDAVIEGTESRARFITSFVPAGQYAGLYLADLRLEPSAVRPDRSDLILTLSVYRPERSDVVGAPTAAPSVRSVLVRDVAAISFQYFAAEDGELEPIWRTAWKHPIRLPLLFAIALSFADADRRNWSRFVVSSPLATLELE
jgi:general secretion pathway protein J